jgi:hypothetical protein
MPMLNIRINSLKVTSIYNLGSLNIGRAILCNNQATTNTYNGQYNGDGDSSQTPFINSGSNTVSPLTDLPVEGLDSEQVIPPNVVEQPSPAITPTLINPL